MQLVFYDLIIKCLYKLYQDLHVDNVVMVMKLFVLSSNSAKTISFKLKYDYMSLYLYQ